MDMDLVTNQSIYLPPNGVYKVIDTLRKQDDFAGQSFLDLQLSMMEIIHPICVVKKGNGMIKIFESHENTHCALRTITLNERGVFANLINDKEDYTISHIGNYYVYKKIFYKMCGHGVTINCFYEKTTKCITRYEISCKRRTTDSFQYEEIKIYLELTKENRIEKKSGFDAIIDQIQNSAETSIGGITKLINQSISDVCLYQERFT